MKIFSDEQKLRGFVVRIFSVPNILKEAFLPRGQQYQTEIQTDKKD